MDFMRDYGQDRELVKQFFRDFSHVDDEAGEVVPKYASMITLIANRKLILLPSEVADVETFSQDLAKLVYENTCRAVKIFYEALDELLPLYKTRELAPEEKDILDVFIDHRTHVRERNQTNRTNPAPSQSTTNVGVDIDNAYPPELLRRYEVIFKPKDFKCIPIREVKAEYIGKFVTVRGIVTRTFEIKPRIVVACYLCDQCGYETFQQIGYTGFEFNPLAECSSSACKANKVLGKLTMQVTRGSKFVNMQEIRIQEHSEQVPVGHIPRTITVICHGELTRKCNSGDHISVSGVFIPVEKSGYRMKSGGLAADTYIEAHYISQMTKTDDQELSDEPMTLEEAEKLITGETNFLARLSSSIAPEIYGHDDLKKALLLLLVGGVENTRKDGMRVRGNINICITGDPGVAKSQLLCFIDRLASRSQYTTGRGSSGVGLTAAVLKDPLTNELILEGGALVLADQGICCIDEFDKMMEADRTAIHEVMEQQTVSISKAGINTALNARVSILAAANPIYGRYNPNKNASENLQLPPALLSRFDLMWLIRDLPSARDGELAEHITNIHMHPDQPPPSEHDALDMKTMRKYINLCKTKQPTVPPSLSDRFVEVYLNIRSRRRLKTQDALFTSPRSLLAIIRLSTALARLRLADEVDAADVDAAVAIYESSQRSIQCERVIDTTGPMVLELIKGIINSGSRTGPMSELEARAAEKRITPEQLQEALEALQKADSIVYDNESITLV